MTTSLPSIIERAWLANRTLLLNIARRRLRSNEDAEDALQDTFLRIMRAADRFDLSRDFAPWAVCILNNIITDILRRRRNGPNFSSLTSRDDGSANPAHLDLPSTDPGPLECLLFDVMSESTQLALGKLNPSYREAILLAYVGQRSYDEIAVHLGVPIGTIRSRIHRGGVLLRTSLTAMAAQPAK